MWGFDGEIWELIMGYITKQQVRKKKKKHAVTIEMPIYGRFPEWMVIPGNPIWIPLGISSKECDNPGCRKKRFLQFKDRITPQVNFFQNFPVGRGWNDRQRR